VTPASPQTKTEIKGLLGGEDFHPNRRRGQNFLIDGNLMRLVVEAAELTSDDVVLEVGTGTGSLTRMLADAAGEVITVEIDSGLERIGEAVLGGIPNVTRIHADALAGKNALNPEVLAALMSAAKKHSRVKLVANLPYSIATPLLMNLTFGDVEFERMTFTVQYEVAERLTALAGSDSYGWVSVVVALAGEAKILRRFGPKSFWPAPTVDSALVLFRPRKEWKHGIDVARLRAFGMFDFQQRRKTVLRNVRDYLRRTGSTEIPESVLERAGIEPKVRGDQLNPQQILKLSQLIG
jgi:16S rRNA (adenine1518-N6/adenine1519-N6)-dimethyltransferase